MKVRESAAMHAGKPAEGRGNQKHAMARISLYAGQECPVSAASGRLSAMAWLSRSSTTAMMTMARPASMACRFVRARSATARHNQAAAPISTMI